MLYVLLYVLLKNDLFENSANAIVIRIFVWGKLYYKNLDKVRKTNSLLSKY